MIRMMFCALAVGYAAAAYAEKWIDGRELPLEGKAFADVESYYDRMPASAQATNTNAGVQWLKHHTSGMVFRFKTTSPTLAFRWTPYYDIDGPQSMAGCRYNGALGMAHMPAIGVSGIDVYIQGKDGAWKYLKSGFIYASRRKGEPSVGQIARFSLAPGTPVMVHLPLYNGLKSFEVEVADDAKVEPLPPRRSGITKPVVFYGTSITQGGCASRPGLAFSHIIGRTLDVPTVNLGFSAHGCMEPAMADYLAQIDASCYVLDCLWNMDTSATPDRRPSCAGRHVDVNYEPLMRKLRAAHPNVPIVMAEQSDVFCRGMNAKGRIIHALYEKLKAEGWQNLVYLSNKGMYSGDREGTVDGTHPNDRGMEEMAAAFGEAIREVLFPADSRK